VPGLAFSVARAFVCGCSITLGRSHGLSDFYGAGAYPVNFPNIWDRRKQRSGHGIWLHGLPKGIASEPETRWVTMPVMT